MRITFVLPHAGLAGGIRVVAIYADRLRRRGHEVFVVSLPRKQVPLKGKVKSWVLGRGWPETPTNEPSHLDGLGLNWRVLERHRPVTDADVPDADVVVATWWETAEWVAKLSPSKGAKAYFIQHDEQLMYGSEQQEKRQRAIGTWLLPMHRIVISKWLLELARTRSGDHAASHVPNSVDTEQFHAEVRGRQAEPTVGMLYSPAWIKGCEVSFRALDVASREIPDLRVLLFGAQRPEEGVALPRNSIFTYQPAQDAIGELYRQCDVWLCGSRAEGFHLPPLEAMACRCPVVSTKVGGPVDVIEDGREGFLVDVEDADALADRLVRVLRLPEDQWRAMSGAAYATATQFTWDDATDLFEVALRVAIERNRRGELAANMGAGKIVA